MAFALLIGDNDIRAKVLIELDEGLKGSRQADGADLKTVVVEFRSQIINQETIERSTIVHIHHPKAVNLHKDIVILMLDIDYFKKVNDTYGHEAGDNILRFVATEIKSQIYGRDYVIRWGGEEFIVLSTRRGYDLYLIRCQKV